MRERLGGVARSEAARAASVPLATAVEEEARGLKFQRLAANPLDFGQICGKMYGSEKYEKSIDFAAIVL
jgi:hypothetical protein